MNTKENLTLENLESEICARDFWEFAKYIKTRDEASGEVRSFPLDYPHLHKTHQTVQDNQITQVHKVRQILMTWYMAARANWRMYQSEYYDKVCGIAIGSKREDDAKEVMARTQFIYDNLPDFLKFPATERSVSTLAISNKAIIHCFPAAPSIGRTFTVTEFFLDELAFLPHAYELWQSFSPSLGVNSKAMLVSTSNGEGNLHYDMWHGDTTHTRLAFYDRDVPGHDEAWREKERTSGKYITKGAWDAERCGEWVVSRGKAVIDNFDRNIHVYKINFKPYPNAIIVRGEDLGYHYPVCLWLWKNPIDQWCVLREYTPEDIECDRFMGNIIDITEGAYPGCVTFDYPDFAGSHPNTVSRKSAIPGEKDQSTDIQIMRAVAREKNTTANIRYAFFNIKPGLDEIRKLLRLRPGDGRPGLIIDESCKRLIIALAGGYHFDEEDVAKEEPVKDGKNDHVVDALRYPLSHLILKPAEKPRPPQRRLVKDDMTGRIM